MGRQPLILLVLLSACSGNPREDLQYIKQARSLAAEWALINEQARADRVTTTYVRSMHHWLRIDLHSASSSLSQPDSPYGAEMRALLAEPADADPDRLRAHVEALLHTEDELESD